MLCDPLLSGSDQLLPGDDEGWRQGTTVVVVGLHGVDPLIVKSEGTSWMTGAGQWESLDKRKDPILEGERMNFEAWKWKAEYERLGLIHLKG